MGSPVFRPARLPLLRFGFPLPKHALNTKPPVYHASPQLLSRLSTFPAVRVSSTHIMEHKPAGSPIFREYIGALFNGVKLSDVPINPSVKTHLILAFAVDSSPSSASPTNGNFNICWDYANISPTDVAAFKKANPNAKVALSLGGSYAYFQPTSIDSWVHNAVSSLTPLIRQYGLDGIDIDYEHFNSDSATFADCIGLLLTQLKNDGVISFASIAPFDDGEVQSNDQALWTRYGSAVLDYVNFQFYAYPKGTTVDQFLGYFDTQLGNYPGRPLLASFDDNSGGLSPEGGFFTACKKLKAQGKLGGIFAWCADSSKSLGFKYEKQALQLLSGA